MNEVVSLVMSAVLSATFYFSGIAKLRERESTRETARQFGLPSVLATAVGYLLPPLEIVIATMLLLPGLARFGAHAGLVLILLFTVLAAIALARGRTPRCNCFGPLSRHGLGIKTLVRNLLLASLLLAATTVYRPDEQGLTGWIVDGHQVESLAILTGLLLCTLLIAVGTVLIKVIQQNGRILLRFGKAGGRRGAG
jgi:hypothetical protein